MLAVRTMVQLNMKAPLKLSVTTRIAMSIFSLPDDILLLIISSLGVKDILTLRQTSKRFHTMTKLRWVWLNAIKKDIIDKGLPVPAADGLSEFSALDLEARTVHAAKFHENWYSPSPAPKKSIAFEVATCFDDFSELYAVRQALFLPGRNGEFVVTVVNRTLTCWEIPLNGTEAYRVAEWTSELLIEKVIMNDDPKSNLTLACLSGDSLQTSSLVVIHVLTLDLFHGKFVPFAGMQASRPTANPLHAMRGEWLVFGNPLRLWHIPTLSPIKAINPQDDSPILTAKIIGKYLVAVSQLSVQVLGYDQTKEDGTPAIPSHCVTLGYRATEAAIVTKTTPAVAGGEERTDWCNDTVSILLRCCDSDFDVMRQYDLPVNPKVSSFNPNPTNKVDLFPCLFLSQYTRTMGVAPSACKLTAGRNGKGFWVETRNITRRRSVFPARCLIGFDVTRTEEDEDSFATSDLHVCENEIYARRCDMSEILCKKYLLNCTDLEDTVGRIAVGYRTGTVEILDYVS